MEGGAVFLGAWEIQGDFARSLRIGLLRDAARRCVVRRTVDFLFSLKRRVRLGRNARFGEAAVLASGALTPGEAGGNAETGSSARPAPVATMVKIRIPRIFFRLTALLPRPHDATIRPPPLSVISSPLSAQRLRERWAS
jgi:hypothetical protein